MPKEWWHQPYFIRTCDRAALGTAVGMLVAFAAALVSALQRIAGRMGAILWLQRQGGGNQAYAELGLLPSGRSCGEEGGMAAHDLHMLTGAAGDCADLPESSLAPAAGGEGGGGVPPLDGVGV